MGELLHQEKNHQTKEQHPSHKRLVNEEIRAKTKRDQAPKQEGAKEKKAKKIKRIKGKAKNLEEFIKNLTLLNYIE